MRLARIATLAAGAAAAYGVRAWRRNRASRDVWAQATDSLPGRSTGTTTSPRPTVAAAPVREAPLTRGTEEEGRTA